MAVTRFWAAFLPFCLLAQQTGNPTIRTNVPLVLLPVTVTDGKGHFIDGLTADDFVVSDEGATQKIRLDTAGTVLAPISLVVAVQTSSIAAAALAKIQQIGSIIRPAIAGERGQVAVIAYDREVRLIQEFTGDETAVRNAIAKLNPRTPKNGALLDAIAQGIKLLEARPESNRRVLLFLGESRDRGSKAQLGPLVEAAQRANIAVYPVTYSAQKTAWTARPEDAPPPPGGPDYIGGFGELFRFGKADAADTLARTTGGRQLSFATQHGLETALTNDGAELHNQYLISFAPLESIGNRYRRVQVRIPSRKAVVRVRPGYWPN
jgi:VWFA-related protein